MLVTLNGIKPPNINKSQAHEGKRNWPALEAGIDDRIGKTNQKFHMSTEKTLRHPLVRRLLEYTTNGCSADCGIDWTRARIEVVTKHGLYSSALLVNERTEWRKSGVAVCSYYAVWRYHGGHCHIN